MPNVWLVRSPEYSLTKFIEVRDLLNNFKGVLKFFSEKPKKFVHFFRFHTYSRIYYLCAKYRVIDEWNLSLNEPTECELQRISYKIE